MKRKPYKNKSYNRRINQGAPDPLRSYITQIKNDIFWFKKQSTGISIKYDELCKIVQRFEFSIKALETDIPIIAQIENRLNLTKEVEEIKSSAKNRRRIVDLILGRPFYTREEEANINQLLKQVEMMKIGTPRTFSVPGANNYIPSGELSSMLSDLMDYKHILLEALPQALAVMKAEEDLKLFQKEQDDLAKARRKAEEQAREDRKIDRTRAKEAKQQEKEKMAREQAERNAALAAEAAGKTRRRAQTIRVQLHKRIEKMNICPYCGFFYDGNTAQADHIYPVSHGGLSTENNMIMVCRDCNRQKSDLTLREFIEKYPHICREEVELRLKMHKKRF